MKLSRLALVTSSGLLSIAAVAGVFLVASCKMAFTEMASTPPAVLAKTANPSPTVRVVSPELLREAGHITLTGRTAPAEQAVVGARASGIVQKRNVDIGDRVAEGDVLLVIDAPEVTQELARARAAIQQARARLDFARVNARRAETLVTQGHLSEQTRDERIATERVSEADLSAAEAEVRRLEEIQGFLTLRAPFAGTVVARAVERGDRITTSDAQSSGPLFRIARLDELRVEIDIPQTAALKVRPGGAARVTFAELPGETFEAKVVRSAGLIDQASSTMRAELMMANPEERIPAGLTGLVSLDIARDRMPVSVPTNTLVTRDGRQKVAVVSDNGTVAFRPVTVGRDFGERVEIVAGLTEQDRVILSPNALLREGDTVEVTTATAQRATQQKTR